MLCFALLCCGDKKVTEEMLLGGWECSQNDQKAKWENGTFQDFGEVKSEKALIIYKTHDGLLMRGRGNDLTKGDWYFISSNLSI